MRNVSAVFESISIRGSLDRTNRSVKKTILLTLVRKFVQTGKLVAPTPTLSSLGIFLILSTMIQYSVAGFLITYRLILYFI